jgi:uncharacterized membrane protein
VGIRRVSTREEWKGWAESSYSNSIYRRQSTVVDYVLGFIFLLIVAFIFFFVTEVAFEKTGFTRLQFLLILAATLIGSYVDIPLWKLRSTRPTIVVREVRAFWITYRIPEYALTSVSTVIALNVGGALVPLIVSSILLYQHPQLLIGVMVATALTAICVHVFARYIEGVGIVSPTLIPPIAAVLFSLPFAGSYLAVTSYIAGTLGTLIGADLSNLGKIAQGGGTHVASIGGAGKFDGIFLTGVVAVLIASLL